MPEIGNKIATADIDLVDETFDVLLSGSYHLSIQIEPGRLSFCVFNTVINKYIVLRSYPVSITDPAPAIGHSSLVSAYSPIFENDNLLSLSYKSSSLLWISPRCTLVPGHFFNPGEEDLYLAFNHGAVAGEHILYRFIRPANLYSVFSIPEELLNLIWMHQPRIHFFHQFSPFIKSVFAGTTLTDNVDMTIYFYSHWLDVVVMKNNKLLFYNSFKIISPADSVYYLAGVSNLFDIDLKTIKLMYTGDLLKMPPEIAILKDFFSTIIECKPPNTVAYSHYITEPFRKDFIHLFNLNGCE